jgi:hypothetical protein
MTDLIQDSAQLKTLVVGYLFFSVSLLFLCVPFAFAFLAYFPAEIP